jgi:hypothetical protein
MELVRNNKHCLIFLARGYIVSVIVDEDFEYHFIKSCGSIHCKMVKSDRGDLCKWGGRYFSQDEFEKYVIHRGRIFIYPSEWEPWMQNIDNFSDELMKIKKEMEEISTDPPLQKIEKNEELHDVVYRPIFGIYF